MAYSHLPTYVGAGAFTSGTAALTVAVPTGLRNNDLLMIVTESANQAITAPTGWTEVGAQASQATGTAAAAGGVRLAVFWKIASGAEAAVTVADSGDHTTGQMFAFRGVDPTNPFGSATPVSKIDASATTAMSWPTLTTTTANNLIVMAAALDADAASTAAVGAITAASLTSISEKSDNTVIAGFGGGITLSTAVKATAGAIGTMTATGSTSTTHAYLTMALQGRSDAIVVPRGQYKLLDMDTVVPTGGQVVTANDGILLQADVSPAWELDNAITPKLESIVTSSNLANTATVTNPAYVPDSSDPTYSARGGNLVHCYYTDALGTSVDQYIFWGGYDGTTRYNNIWIKDMRTPGRPWRKLTTTGTPPTAANLAGAVMTYPAANADGFVRPTLFIWGGNTGAADSNQMFKLDLTTNAWTSITQTSAPTARSYITKHLVAVPTPGTSQVFSGITSYTSYDIYFFGGWAAARENQLVKATYAYNTTAVTWTTLKATGTAGNPSIRSGAIMDYKASTNKLYIYGGYNGTSYLSDFWSYDITGNTFTQETVTGTAPQVAELGAGGFDAANNRFWFAGGWNSAAASGTHNHVGYVSSVGSSASYVIARADDNDNQAFPQMASVASTIDTKRGWLVMYSMQTFDSTERYSFAVDLNDGITTNKPVYGLNDSDWMTARDAPASVYNTLTNEWLVINGFANMGDEVTIATGTHTNDIWAYDSNLNRWRYANKGYLGMPHTEGSTAVYDSTRDRIIVFGGLSGISETSNEVWSATRDANGMYKWARLNPTGTKPVSRWLTHAVFDSANNRVLFALGGDKATQLNEVWEISFTGGADGVWTQRTPTGSVTAVVGAGFAAKTSSTRLYIFGGATVPALTTVSSQLVYLDYSTTNCAWTTPTSSAGTARRTPALGYDPGSDRLIAFAGFNGTNSINTLSYWNVAAGGAWVNGAPTVIPDARRSSGYNFVDGLLYVTHGRSDSSPWYKNTWTLAPNYTTPASSVFTNLYARTLVPQYFTFDPNTTGSYHWQSWITEEAVDQTKVSYPQNKSTYYFNASDAGPANTTDWTNPANAFDGSTLTAATSTTNASSTYMTGDGTNAPITGDAVSQVRWRAFCKFSGDGGSGFWSGYSAVTAPALGWTWQKINDLQVGINSNFTGSASFPGQINFNIKNGAESLVTAATVFGVAIGTGQTLSVYRVEVEVTTSNSDTATATTDFQLGGASTLTRTHTTDAVKRKQNTVTHTTSANKKKTTTVSHTTDARRWFGKSHTTDALKTIGTTVTEYTFPTAASGDDANQVVATGVVNITDTGNGGTIAKLDGTNHGGFRFPNVTIANGTTITYAKIYFEKLNNYQGFGNMNTTTWYMEDVDNSAAFTTAANNISGRTRNTTYTLTGADAGLVWENTGHDFTNAVQATLNRAGWASGNAMAALAIGTGTAGGFIQPYMWDYLSGFYHAKLVIGITTAAHREMRRQHTTDAYKSIGVPNYTKTHTTDAFKRRQLTLTHTTDALKRKQNTKVHTTDANKKKTTTVFHTTDANKKKTLTIVHTTDANKRVSGNLHTHTTDALKRSQNTRTHTTDALKRKQFTKTHTTDAFLRRQITKTHTTDANKKKTFTITHSTDANKKKANLTVTHTTDALKRQQFTKTHTTDGFKRLPITRTHTTDAFLRRQITKVHTTDANKKRATLVSHTTDSNKKLTGNLRTHTTDANKKKTFTVAHTTSANKRTTGLTRTHTTDALKRTQNTRTHTTDSFKRTQNTRTHTTDAFLRRQITKVHTTDSNKRKATLVSHTTDTNKKKTTSVSHSTDAFKRRQLTLTHTTDAFKRKQNTVSHTTDSLKRKQNTITHTTDANKRVSGFTRTHTTDAFKRTQNIRSHTTDANKKKTLTATHTTDALKKKRLTLTHTTDAYSSLTATIGPNNPGTATDSGSGFDAWVNPGNVFTSNDTYATSGMGFNASFSNFLRVSNFGFAIPAGATINGIKVEIERKGNSTITDKSITLMKNLVSVGSDKADTVTTWPTSDAYATYGSVSDVWGTTWTVNDINNANFGVSIQAKESGGFNTASIDHVRISVTYTPGIPKQSHTTDANKRKVNTLSHTTDANKKKTNTLSHTTDAGRVALVASGPRSPGTGADSSAVGTITWNNPGNILTSDNTYADATAAVSGGTSHYLKGTNFGFSIPSNATIRGILVEIEKRASGNGVNFVQDSRVSIIKSDGSIGTTNKGDTVTKWNTSDTYISYGSSSDLWGETWAYSDINDVDFGVALSALLTVDTSVSAFADHMRITVYYTTPTPTFTTTHTTDALKRKQLTVSHTTDTNKRKATLVSHTTDTNKKKTSTVTHTTDALKRRQLTVSHTTDALKRKQFTKTHTTDAFLRRQITKTHTTDSFLRRQITKTHSTDANKRKATLVSHTTDANKRLAGLLRTHTTDALKRRTVTVSHTTDSFKRRQLALTHTTDAFKRTQNTRSHTTDANKKRATLVSHTTDANKKKAGLTRTHTTDALLRRQLTKIHTTDALKRRQLTLTHTTDSFKRTQNIKVHTTDALKKRAYTVTHTTDANRKKATLVSHTTDSNKKKTTLVSHTTDANKRVTGFTRTHTTDTLLRRQLVKTHTTDALKRRSVTVSHTTDAFRRTPNVVVHSTDANKKRAYTATHTTDSNKKKAGITRFHTTDANKRVSGIVRTHSTDTLKRTQNIKTHTTDALKRTQNVKTHTTDAFKRRAVTVSHTTDSNKRKTLTVSHATDANKKKTLSVFHTTDANKRKTGLTRTHSTDALLRRQLVKTHTTDTLKRTQSTRTHTTDAFKRTQNIKTHTTDSNKRRAALVSHTTDSNKRRTGIIVSHTTDANKRKTGLTRSHTTDAFKRTQNTRFHSTDTNKKRTYTVTHTTDTYKRGANERIHSTDANKRRATTVSHTTSANRRKATLVSHTTDALRHTQNTRSHTADTIVHDYRYYTREQNPVLPTDAAPRSIGFLMTEVPVVATDNSTYIDQFGAKYLLFYFEQTTYSVRNQIYVTWNGKSTIDTSTRPVYLQIWNYTSGLWETLDMNNSTPNGTDFTLTGSKLTSLTDYYNANITMVARVYQ